jgi:hypothetical protein
VLPRNDLSCIECSLALWTRPAMSPVTALRSLTIRAESEAPAGDPNASVVPGGWSTSVASRAPDRRAWDERQVLDHRGLAGAAGTPLAAVVPPRFFASGGPTTPRRAQPKILPDTQLRRTLVYDIETISPSSVEISGPTASLPRIREGTS